MPRSPRSTASVVHSNSSVEHKPDAAWPFAYKRAGNGVSHQYNRFSRSRGVLGCAEGGSDMPRTMWKGAISFGLVSIPIRVFPATEEKSLRFNQLHDKDGGRIKYQRVCSVCGEEVSFDHIVKGYEYEKDHYVTLDDEDFDAVPVASSRAIDIQQFVDLAEIDPVYYKKS